MSETEPDHEIPYAEEIISPTEALDVAAWMAQLAVTVRLCEPEARKFEELPPSWMFHNSIAPMCQLLLNKGVEAVEATIKKQYDLYSYDANSSQTNRLHSKDIDAYHAIGWITIRGGIDENLLRAMWLLSSASAQEATNFMRSNNMFPWVDEMLPLIEFITDQQIPLAVSGGEGLCGAIARTHEQLKLWMQEYSGQWVREFKE